MPPAKRASSTTKPSAASKKPAAARKSAATGAKSTATTARKATGRTTTQAKAGTTRTSRSASAGAAKTASTAKRGAAATAKAAGDTVTETAKSAKAGAKGTATVARAGAKQTTSRAKAANTRAQRATGGDGVVAATIKGAVRPRESVTLTRDKIQETLDEAASRGRVTRKDANDLVAELMRRGRQTGDEMRGEVGELLEKGVNRIETATKKVRKAEPVDRLVRGADRARRAAGVGPTFPIIGYDELNVGQVQARIKELSKPDQRRVLTYERRNANRKTIVGALEKSLA